MVYDLVSDFLHCCIVSGETPLIQAARQSHTSTAKYLIEHGANPALESELGAIALIMLLEHVSFPVCDIELMEALLSSTGVEVDSQSDVGTPFVWASGHRQQDALKLTKCGDIETDDGITPLLSAVAAGSLPCLELLIQVLFPVSSHVETIPKWSVDGIIQYMQSEGSKNQVTAETKKKSGEAKSRADDAYRQKEYLMAVDAYTQVICN
ncbi:hypothetical protein LXL04_022156 [Taraxacum kok-saghyz]